ncbi:MAG: hypothetical protein ABMA15_15625 [Vicinamibacterales bacterium]
MPGTEGASFPFWSPDGRFVAFFAAGKLKKVDIARGRPQVLCDVPAGRGGAWSPAGIIVFGQSISPLSQVPADGGAVTPATSFDMKQDPAWHYWPPFLPDGRHFIYLQRSLKPEYQGIYVTSLDSPRTTTRLIGTDVRALFASGQLLFMRDGLLFAQALNERTFDLTGEAVRIADNVGYYAAAFGYAAVDASSRDAIVMGPPLSTSRQLQSLDRKGTPMRPAFEGAIASPRLSADGGKLLMSIRDSGTANSDIWLFDVARGLPSRVTFDPSTDFYPAWMPDGVRVAFATTRVPTSQGANVIFQKSINGAGLEEPLDASSPVRGFPDDVSSDGHVMLVRNLTSRGYDIYTLDLQPTAKPLEFLSTPFNEVQARFSPDRRWVAYASDESGRFEVYVRAFPSGTERIPVSVKGGMQPEWRRDGRELFFLAPGGEMMAVPITLEGSALKFGTQQALFRVDVAEPVPPFPNDYAVSADGQRFFVTTLVEPATSPTLTLELNWTAALRNTR